jgi:mannose-6-phosphate isomerase-like protein (cupin superfamily)
MNGGNVSEELENELEEDVEVEQFYKVFRRAHPIVEHVLWDDVINKMDIEFKKDEAELIMHTLERPPTFVTRENYLPGQLKMVYEKISEEVGVEGMHMYTSFGARASTFDRHKDVSEVYIVQAIGSTYYEFDDGEVVDLARGDALYIRPGTWHRPIINTPRVSLSFTLKDASSIV